MSESLRIADHLWNDAEALVDRVEHSSRVETAQQVVFDQLTGELARLSAADSVTLLVVEHGKTTTLSRNGSATTAAVSPANGDRSPTARWISPLCLEAQATLSPDTKLGLSLCFLHPVDGTLSQPLCELSETLLTIATTVYLRGRFAELTSRMDDQSRRDRVLDQLNQGNDLSESFAAISAVIASETGCDRVCLLSLSADRFRLIASSSQPHVDRRARQVRLLERLVKQSCDTADQFDFVVGYPSDRSIRFEQTLQEYVTAAGSREIRIEVVRSHDETLPANRVIAAIMLERFQLQDSDTAVTERFDRLRSPVQSAIRRAVQRSQISWSTLAGRLAAARTSRRTGLLACALVLLGVAVAMIPVELKIPVEGRLVAAKHQRVFAPADSVVSELLVEHGQKVSQGQELVLLRSARLDQQQRQVEGDLETAQTRLAIATATKSGASGSRGSAEHASIATASSDEQVLKSEISGLQKQLDQINQQQSQLRITSPIDGVVDRWNLRQSLHGRPVVHGHFLMELRSLAEGWVVELDVPDSDSLYVAEAQASAPCVVTFRLRSNPDRPYRGSLRELSNAAQLDAAGNPVVPATLDFGDHQDAGVRSGATVTAKIHCGSRPLAAVWFRSLIEWSRRIDWL